MQRIKRLAHDLPIHMKLLLGFLGISACCFTILFGFGVPYISRLAQQNVLFSASQALSQTQSFISYRLETMLQYAYSIAYSDSVIGVISKNPKEESFASQVRDYESLMTVVTNANVSHYPSISRTRFFINDDFIFLPGKQEQLLPYSLLQRSPWRQNAKVSSPAYEFIPPSRLDGQRDISVIHFISDPSDYSTYIGAVALDMPVSVVSEILRNCTVTPNSYAYLVSEEGLFVASSDEAYDSIPKEHLLLVQSEQNSQADADNLYYISRLRPCKWAIIQVIPRSDIGAIQRSEFGIYLFYGIVLLGVSLVLSVWISGNITKRLRTLSGAMRTYQYHQTQALPVPKTGDDIDYLLASYNLLITQVNQLGEEKMQETRRLGEAQLSLLHMQMNPHLLFNTLEMIRSLTDAGQCEQASQAIEALARFYRTSLSKDRTRSTLEMELEHVSNYIQIERTRSGDSIVLQIDVPPELLNLELPHITLQPLVENALVHGIRNRKDRSGTIRITAMVQGDTDAVISVWDDGCGISQMQLLSLLRNGQSGGIGLGNTNERIRILFGDGYGLSIHSSENEFTQVCIKVRRSAGKE